MKREILIGVVIGILFFTLYSAKDTLVGVISPKKEVVRQAEKKTPLNSSELKDVFIENIEVNGKTYNFEYGNTSAEGKDKKEVERIAYFYTITREDPLFSSPDFNLPAFTEQIKRLAKEEENFKKTIKRDDPIFPNNFLNSLTEVAKAEDKFFNTISKENAQNLIESYKKTEKLYRKDAETFLTNLEKNSEYFPNTSFIYVGSTSNKEIFYSDIKKITLNAQALEKEIKNRENCLKGFNCKRFSIKKPLIDSTSVLSSPKVLPEQILMPYRGGQIKRKELTGPFLVETNCFGSNQQEFIYVLPTTSNLLKKPDGEYLDIVHFKLADDNYYRLIGNGNMDNELKKAGLTERVPQLETRSYMCPDLSYQPNLLTAFDFFEKNQKTIIMAEDFKEKDYWEKAGNFEKELLNSKNPSVNDSNTLSEIYKYGYFLLKEAKKDEFLRRSLVIERKLSSFHLILATAETNFFYLYLLQSKDPDFFKSESNFYGFVYPSRSLWNLLYFPFSPSFWRIEKPEYVSKRIVELKNIELKKKPFINYKEAMQLYSEEEILKWHKINDKYLQDEADKLLKQAL